MQQENEQLTRRSFLRLGAVGAAVTGTKAIFPTQLLAQEKPAQLTDRTAPVNPVRLQSSEMELVLDRSDGVPFLFRLSANGATLRGEDFGKKISVTVCQKTSWKFLELQTSPAGARRGCLRGSDGLEPKVSQRVRRLDGCEPEVCERVRSHWGLRWRSLRQSLVAQRRNSTHPVTPVLYCWPCENARFGYRRYGAFCGFAAEVSRGCSQTMYRDAPHQRLRYGLDKTDALEKLVEKCE